LPGDLQPLVEERLFRAFLRSLFLQKWVVYAKPPFGGPQHVLHYLARYTHRVAISNHRIVNFADDKVTFRWKDYAHGNKKRVMTLSAEEFLRRFLMHTLPRRFVRIRSFGFLANRRRKTLLPLCRTLLNAPSPEAPEADVKPALWRCPQCGGPMAVVERLSTQQLQWALSKSEAILDSS
jgi:hypothetical protein